MHKNRICFSTALLFLSIYLLSSCSLTSKVDRQTIKNCSDHNFSVLVLPSCDQFPESKVACTDLIYKGIEKAFSEKFLTLEVKHTEFGKKWTIDALCGNFNIPPIIKNRNLCNTGFSGDEFINQEREINNKINKLFPDKQINIGYYLTVYVEYIGPGDGPKSYKYRVHGALISAKEQKALASWSWKADTATDAISAAMTKIGPKIHEIIFTQRN